MTPWLDAFAPAFGLIALGAVLRARLVRDPAAWAGMERLVFYVLLPCLLASSIGATDPSRLPVGAMAAALWGALLAGAAASYALARAFGLGHAATTSLLQGGIRFNNLTAFAVVGGALGPEAVALAGVAVGLIVPAVQAILAVAFALGADGPRPSPLRLAGRALSNPLLLGCLAGFALAAMGGPPPGVAPLLRALGGGSVALGLLAVGAALTPAALAGRPGVQAATAGLKLAAVPLATLALGAAAGLGPLPLAVAVLCMAQPTATTGYVMARALGGDAPLVAALITGQHLAAALTLPLWVWVLT